VTASLLPVAVDTGRRALLQAGALAAAGGRPFAPARRDLVRAENARPGTTAWMLDRPRLDPGSRCRSSAIEGYASRSSVRAGEPIEIFVSTDPPSPFVIDVYRMGHYGGKGGRHVARLGPFRGQRQPDPEVGARRLRACRWEPATRITVPRDWVSGVHLAKLTAERGGAQSYVVFIVRDDRRCDFLFQCSDATWAAYNRWPDFYSLYDDGLRDRGGWYVGPDVAVSFDRPYGKYRQVVDGPLSLGSGEFLLWELPLAHWMEARGYDVSYVGNLDTHEDGAGLLRARAFLSVGHDEYWSPQMYENVRRAIAGGLHAAFLSGNSCDGVIDLDGGGGRAGRPLRSFARVGLFGPDEARARAHEGRWTRHGPDPALLMGARTTRIANGRADFTCVNEKHWLFEGTGMRNGDAIAGLVGWEHHGDPAELAGLEVLATGPVFHGDRPLPGIHYTAVTYPGPRGNVVFNAATIWWAQGLCEPPGHVRPSAHGGGPRGPDPRVARMTANLFARFLA
jgi:hypothetical protein